MQKWQGDNTSTPDQDNAMDNSANQMPKKRRNEETKLCKNLKMLCDVSVVEEYMKFCLKVLTLWKSNRKVKWIQAKKKKES